MIVRPGVTVTLTNIENHGAIADKVTGNVPLVFTGEAQTPEPDEMIQKLPAELHIQTGNGPVALVLDNTNLLDSATYVSAGGGYESSEVPFFQMPTMSLQSLRKMICFRRIRSKNFYH